MIIAKFKILAVDDSAIVRSMIKGFLENYTFIACDFAKNGNDALTRLNSSNYDLILLDWNMPNMSGIEFLRVIRSNERLKEIFVIMITAEAKKENVLAAVQAGVNDYIVKPFSSELLGKKLKKILNALMFGSYLVARGIINNENMKEALDRQQRASKMLGEVGVELGLVTMDDVGKIVAIQKEAPIHKKFGEVAIAQKMLSGSDVERMVETQQTYHSKIGDILVAMGALSEQKLKNALDNFNFLKSKL